MAYKIPYTEEVLADLEEVTAYAEQNFPEGSENLFSSLLDQIELLQTYPRMGSMQSQSGVRKIYYTPFVIYYRILEPQQRIDIVHIWHGSRRPPAF